jgi:hypothetical protein
VERLREFISRPGPIAGWAIFFVIVIGAIYGGILFRLWFYPVTDDHHFRYDIHNAWDQGSNVYADAVFLQKDGQPIRWSSFLKAYLGRYDTVMSELPEGNYQLDYPPARLLIMSLWVKAQKGKYIPFFSDVADEKFARPLLWINTTAELLAAVLAFFVARHVLAREDNPWRNWRALAAGLLIWWNVAVIFDWLWPQWDSWVLPFYMLAAWLALNRRWLFVGLCIGVGMLFKGQVLCTAAVFVLWPLFQGRWRAVLEVVVGASFGLFVCVSPWLIRTPWAGVSLIVLLAGAIFGARYVPKQWRVLLVGTAAPISISLSGRFFGGSFAWWWVPFAYSSHHFLFLGVGSPNNLPILLADRFGWSLQDVVTPGGRFYPNIGIRAFLVAIYGITLVACAFGLARQDLRNDRRVLLALATPWLLMFTFMPQMHERYLYWGAALTALAAGVSLGMTLLHIVISALACVAMGNWLFRADDSPFARVLQGMFPDSAWAVILITLIFLYLSIAPSAVRDVRRDPAQESLRSSEPSFAGAEN